MYIYVGTLWSLWVHHHCLGNKHQETLFAHYCCLENTHAYRPHVVGFCAKNYPYRLIKCPFTQVVFMCRYSKGYMHMHTPRDRLLKEVLVSRWSLIKVVFRAKLPLCNYLPQSSNKMPAFLESLRACVRNYTWSRDPEKILMISFCSYRMADKQT